MNHSVDAQFREHGVQVAPRTYRNWKAAMPSARTVSDAHLTGALRPTVGTPEGLYGRRKMTAYLRRQGSSWLSPSSGAALRSITCGTSPWYAVGQVALLNRDVEVLDRQANHVLL